MEISILKARKKELKMTLDDIAEKSGIPKRTLEDIFRGATKNPRVDTMAAIEQALELDQSTSQAIPEDKIFSLIQQLNEQEVKELSNYIDYLLSKRKRT